MYEADEDDPELRHSFNQRQQPNEPEHAQGPNAAAAVAGNDEGVACEDDGEVERVEALALTLAVFFSSSGAGTTTSNSVQSSSSSSNSHATMATKEGQRETEIEKEGARREIQHAKVGIGAV